MSVDVMTIAYRFYKSFAVIVNAIQYESVCSTPGQLATNQLASNSGS